MRSRDKRVGLFIKIICFLTKPQIWKVERRATKVLKCDSVSWGAGNKILKNTLNLKMQVSIIITIIISLNEVTEYIFKLTKPVFDYQIYLGNIDTWVL